MELKRVNCATYYNECKKTVECAWAKVERGNRELGDELKERNKGLFHHEL
jgi:hypothetical protein